MLRKTNITLSSMSKDWVVLEAASVNSSVISRGTTDCDVTRIVGADALLFGNM